MVQKEIIQEIRNEQKKMAQEQFQLASNLSIFMNKQEQFNTRMIDLIETNPLTKRKGIVEDIEDIKENVTDLKKYKDVTAGKIGIIYIVVTALLTFLGILFWKIYDIVFLK